MNDYCLIHGYGLDVRKAISIRMFLPQLALFIFGFMLRSIPEIMVGRYPIGNDTIVHYAPYIAKFKFDLLNMAYWGHLTGWPFMKAIYGVVNDPYITLKIVGPILYGFLLASFYSLVVSFDLGQRKSILISLLMAVQIPALRLSWDLFHNVLGLCFMFLAFGELERIHKSNEARRKFYVGFAILCFLTAITHQMTFFILAAVTIFSIIEIFLKGIPKPKARSLVNSIIPSLLVFGLIVALPRFGPPTNENPFRILYRDSLMEEAATRFFVNYLDFFNYFELFNHIVVTFAVAFAPLLPLALIGYRRTKLPVLLRYYTAIVLLCTFSPLILGVSLFHWDRWMWLLVFPLNLCAFNGISALSETIQGLKLGSLTRKLLRVLLVSVATFSLVFLCFVYVARPESNPFILYHGFPSMWYMPETMQKTSIPFEYIPDLTDCVRWLDANVRGNSAILFGSQFSGFVLLGFTPKDNVTLVSYYQKEFNNVFQESLSLGFRPIYVIWWTFYGTLSFNQSIDFLSVYKGGIFSIYGVSTSFEPPNTVKENDLISFGDRKYVEVAHNNSLTPRVFTVEFWAKPSSFSNWSRWMGKSQYTSAVKNGWEIMWGNDANDPSICLALWDKNNTERRSQFVNVNLNQWTHVAFVFDGSRIRSFRNGNLTETVDIGEWELFSSLDSLRIGTASGGGIYDGLIASLRIYNRSLFSYEIANNLFGRIAREGLVLELNFVRSNSTILQDLSGEGNDGVIISNPAMKP